MHPVGAQNKTLISDTAVLESGHCLFGVTNQIIRQLIRMYLHSVCILRYQYDILIIT